MDKLLEAVYLDCSTDIGLEDEHKDSLAKPLFEQIYAQNKLEEKLERFFEKYALREGMAPRAGWIFKVSGGGGLNKDFADINKAKEALDYYIQIAKNGGNIRTDIKVQKFHLGDNKEDRAAIEARGDTFYEPNTLLQSDGVNKLNNWYQSQLQVIQQQRKLASK